MPDCLHGCNQAEGNAPGKELNSRRQQT